MDLPSQHWHYNNCSAVPKLKAMVRPSYAMYLASGDTDNLATLTFWQTMITALITGLITIYHSIFTSLQCNIYWITGCNYRNIWRQWAFILTYRANEMFEMKVIILFTKSWLHLQRTKVRLIMKNAGGNYNSQERMPNIKHKTLPNNYGIPNIAGYWT